MSSSDSESDDEFLDQQLALQTAALTTILEEIDFLLQHLNSLQELLRIQQILQKTLQTWTLNTTGSHILQEGKQVSVYTAISETIKSDIQQSQTV